MSRVPRRLSFWILVPDTRRFRWDDRAIRPSSAARRLRSTRRGPERGQRRARSRHQRSDALQLAQPDRIDRGEQSGLKHRRTRRADSGKEAHPRPGDRTRGRAEGRRRVEGGGEPKGGTRRSEMIAATAFPSRWPAGSWVCRSPDSTSTAADHPPRARDPARDAHRPDHRHPRRVQWHLRHRTRTR